MHESVSRISTILSTATYPVGKELVAGGDRGAARGSDAVPPERLLAERRLRVVVAEERCERSCLHPAVAQLLVGVPVEATRVGTDHRDLEELELEDALNHLMQVRPQAVVVAELHHHEHKLDHKR
jgi:hypothetical protein